MSIALTDLTERPDNLLRDTAYRCRCSHPSPPRLASSGHTRPYQAIPCHTPKIIRVFFSSESQRGRWFVLKPFLFPQRRRSLVSASASWLFHTHQLRLFSASNSNLLLFSLFACTSSNSSWDIVLFSRFTVRPPCPGSAVTTPPFVY